MPIYKAVLPRLKSTDIDREIKETAIGAIVAYLGDVLATEVSGIFPLILERLQNEIIRVVALRALTQMSLSPLKLDFSSIAVKS